MFNEFIAEKGWQIVARFELPGRAEELVSLDDLDLHDSVRQAASCYQGLYRHQKAAIEKLLQGENVGISTGTGSGKSLVFQLSAMEYLARDPEAKILALYPMKALGNEQEERWNQRLSTSGLQASVARIDGTVNTKERVGRLKNASILVMTPDVVHAWLLSSLSEPAVRNFLRKMRLVIIDEGHTYTGVFGSNSAYLFRRLRYCTEQLGGKFNVVSASATLKDTTGHLETLVGLPFSVIGADLDTAKKWNNVITLVNPPSADGLKHYADLLNYIGRSSEKKFLMFVDSRKQSEYVAAVTNRGREEEPESLNESVDTFLKESDIRSGVCCYRAGLEEENRREIQKALSAGGLRGVVATSALELGIDIQGLTTLILDGIPTSGTSFWQRIGRVGRNCEGEIIIVNNGSPASTCLFNNPESFRSLPLGESALYLQNDRIQFMQALCVAGQDGEADMLGKHVGTSFSSDQLNKYFPPAFVEICMKEREGTTPQEYIDLKLNAHDDPHHAFPIRNIERLYQVKENCGGTEISRGELTHPQLMREAYPGAVYYHDTRPYRVSIIRDDDRQVRVRREKRGIFTRPLWQNPGIHPDLKKGLYRIEIYNDLILAESKMTILESIVGYEETRGKNTTRFPYPLQTNSGYYFQKPALRRTVFTSGVTITHPGLNSEGVDIQLFCKLLFDAFLVSVPFERQDVSYGGIVKLNQNMPQYSIKPGDRAVCLYDQSFGGFRLTGRILDKGNILKVFTKAGELIGDNDDLADQIWAHTLLETLTACASVAPAEIVGDSGENQVCNEVLTVLAPGSRGILLQNENPEVIIADVYYNAPEQKVMYDYYYSEHENHPQKSQLLQNPVDFVRPIDGESRMARFDLKRSKLIISEDDS